VDNLGESFFASADYTSIKKFAQEIESIISEESFVKKKEKTIKVKNFTEVITFLMNDAKKGQSFQRYKGLGEMNPEQWGSQNIYFYCFMLFYFLFYIDGDLGTFTLLFYVVLFLVLY
jgi:hypothetical protein